MFWSVKKFKMLTLTMNSVSYSLVDAIRPFSATSTTRLHKEKQELVQSAAGGRNQFCARLSQMRASLVHAKPFRLLTPRLQSVRSGFVSLTQRTLWPLKRTRRLFQYSWFQGCVIIFFFSSSNIQHTQILPNRRRTLWSAANPTHAQSDGTD